MNFFKSALWINKFDYNFKNFEEIPSALFESINKDLRKVQSEVPLVSILISAWNEEVNILKTIASLSQMKSKIPFEIVVINNNSNDNTQKTLDRLKISNFFQPIQGWGPARQMGQEKARGKYILLADADCLYPECWIDEMMKALKSPGVVCVYGRYSFIPEERYPRWKLYILEMLKDVIAEIRQYKRPYLNAYGISMGYIKEYGLRVGFVMHKVRGEDGRMCFDLMQFGKIKQVKANRARAWTGIRTLDKDGSFGNALRARMFKEIKRFTEMFKASKPHDTNTSTNE